MKGNDEIDDKTVKKGLIERNLEHEIEKHMARREMIAIRGPRQSGKTTLMKILDAGLKGKSDTAFINLDIPDNRKEIENNAIDFAKRFLQGKKLTMFLDEVQRCKNIGESLKIIYDTFEDVKLVISGSSSMEMKANIFPFLVGRMFVYDLLTFDFYEYLSSKDKNLARLVKEKQGSLRAFIDGGKEPEKPSFTSEILGYWKEYTIFGGYPEVVKAGNEEERKLILNSIKNLYVEKDIVSFFKIEDSGKFEDFTKALAFQISNLLNVSNISGAAGISHKNAEEFLEILQHTYMIRLLKPFHKNVITEIRKSPKVYFLDLGMRNAVIGNFVHFDNRDDRGKLAENFVLRQLITGYPDCELKYWRTTGKAEVDFILSKSAGIVPIEVRLSETKIGKSLHSFIASYKPEKAFIATLDRFEMKKIGNTEVWFLPIYYF